MEQSQLTVAPMEIGLGYLAALLSLMGENIITNCQTLNLLRRGVSLRLLTIVGDVRSFAWIMFTPQDRERSLSIIMNRREIQSTSCRQ
jgi:hypothetical protein